jgi:hypothetical protein
MIVSGMNISLIVIKSGMVKARLSSVNKENIKKMAKQQ